MIGYNISVENWREYEFKDGFKYRIDFPSTLYIKNTPKGDTHRVVDRSGVTHYVPNDWRIIRWDGPVVK